MQYERGTIFWTGKLIERHSTAHASGKIALRHLNYQVIVTVHQIASVAQPTEACRNLAQTDQIHHPVIVVEKDIVTGIAARSDVIDRVGEFEPKGASWRSRVGLRPLGMAVSRAANARNNTWQSNGQIAKQKLFGARRGYRRAVVAIAAKNARVAWAVLKYGEDFRLGSRAV